MSARQRYLLPAVLLAAVLLAITAPEQEPELRAALATRVKVAAVGRHDLVPSEIVNGRLDPARRAALHFELAALFRSLLDPLVVMIAIPFSVIGVVFGRTLFDYNLQFLSVIGVPAPTGIVVNDSLILVSFARRMRAEGTERVEAMLEAGRLRVRPIPLTSITTFLGCAADLLCHRSGRVPVTDGGQPGIRPDVRERDHPDRHPGLLPVCR